MKDVDPFFARKIVENPRGECQNRCFARKLGENPREMDEKGSLARKIVEIAREVTPECLYLDIGGVGT